MEYYSKNVLGIERASENSLSLILADEKPLFDLKISDTTWKVDDHVGLTTAHINCKEGVLKKVEIVGPKNELENLLISAGFGTPGKAFHCYYK